ncbi:hypothetical protein FS837_012294 [Tulasnella sp. UAMH 9824]|nr:hypothetical protein FS837_012294 [Tulasnella sp. UAMH 9824]
MAFLSVPDRRALAPRPRKTIILAFDGTANKFGFRNTNIVRLFSLLEKENSQEQVLYYQPGIASNGGIKIVRQALALDERRAKFKPSLWHQSSKRWSHLMEKKGDEFSQDPRLSGSQRHTPSADSIRATPSISSESTIHSGRPPSFAESFGPPEDRHARDYDCGAAQTDVMEVWFAGCHPDVGGRLFEATGASLSDPSFRWMFNQILAANVPMYFKKEALDNLKYFNVYESRHQRPLGPVMTSKGSHSGVEKLEQKDAVSAATAEMRDHLQRRGLWWMVEVIPFRRSTWKGDDEPWEKRRNPNLGKGRKIWNHHVLVHESVKLRMERSGYIPAARFVRNDPDVKFVDDFGNEVAEGHVQGKRLVSFEETGGSQTGGKADSYRISTIDVAQPTDKNDTGSDTENDEYPLSPITFDSGHGERIADARL